MSEYILNWFITSKRPARLKTRSHSSSAFPVELDISQAVPIGPNVNEIVSNAIKYAFKFPVQAAEINIH